MAILLILLFASFGGVIGLLIGIAVPGAAPAFAVLTSCLFGAAGLALAYAFLYFRSIRKRKRSQRFRPAPRSKRPEQSQRPFADRLALFVESTSESAERATIPRESKMAFWASAKTYARTPPKSIFLIRTILWNIAKIVRG